MHKILLSDDGHEILLPRLLKEVVEIGGHLIPKDTTAWILICMLHRDEAVFSRSFLSGTGQLTIESYFHTAVLE